MSTFTLTLNTDNDAFADGNLENEIARILSVATAHVRRGETEFRLKDVNGNRVGSATLELDDDD